jgi:ceramide glucosyltransferase
MIALVHATYCRLSACNFWPTGVRPSTSNTGASIEGSARLTWFLRHRCSLSSGLMQLMIDASAVTHALSSLSLTGATAGVLYNLVAAFLVLRFPRAGAAAKRPLPDVTVLKPLHGSEPGLFSRLASFCDQRYPAEIQLICGAQSASDEALDVARLLARLRPNIRTEISVSREVLGSNRKVSNLIGMQRLLAHDFIILSDSDIIVDEDFVSLVVSELEQPGIGAVSCAYYGIAAGEFWARVSALNTNAQFLPNVIVALTFRAVRPCFGSAIALRKSTLERIGGLSAFADELADDFAIGKAVRNLGLEVAIPRFAVGHVCFERTFRSFWDHHMRSSRTIRSIDPVGYLGLLFMHPLMLAVVAAATGTQYAGLLIACALASRVILSSCVERSFGLPHQPSWTLLIHDVISFAVFVSSFFGNRIAWRGYSYRILQDGTIEKDL